MKFRFVAATIAVLFLCYIYALAVGGMGGGIIHAPGGGGAAKGRASTVTVGQTADADFITGSQVGFRAAIDRCGTAPCTVRVLAATYTFTGAFESSANITMDWEPGAVVMPANGSTNLISSSGNMTGLLTITSTGAAKDWQGSYLLRINSSATVDGVLFKNVSTGGADASGSLGTFTSGNGPIVMIGKNPTLRHLQTVNIFIGGPGAQRDLIKVYKAYNAIIEDSNLQDSNHLGVPITFLRPVDSTGTIFQNNYVEGNVLNTTVVNRGTNDNVISSGTVVRFNTFYSTGVNDGSGIINLDDCFNCEISFNRFLQRDKGGNAIGFVGFANGSGTVITDNFFGNFTNAVNLNSLAFNIWLHGNKVINCTNLFTDAGANDKRRDNFVNGVFATDD